MRIWHQSFTVLQDLPAYADALKLRIGEVVRPDTEVVLHGGVGSAGGVASSAASCLELHLSVWVGPP